MRVYQAWKGNNIFLFGGRFIFAPDATRLPLTIALILVPSVILCQFVARYFLQYFYAGYVILTIAVAFTFWVLILLLMTSSQDPGIVPRASHPVEEHFSYGHSVFFEGGRPGHQFSRTKQVCLNGLPVTVSYCDTCMIYRPPRSSHCSICDNCVERADHHCPWIGQCIGLTTREELKNRLEKKQSIYDRGWLNNFAQILCTKIDPSKFDLRGFIQEEAVKPLPVISLPETEDLQVNSRMKVVDRDDVDKDLPKLSPHRNHIEVDMEMGWTERGG